MKVIRHGILGDGWRKEFECFICGAVIEIDKDDLKVYVYPYYYGETSIRFECPECGTEISVTKEIPSMAQTGLVSKIIEGRGF